MNDKVFVDKDEVRDLARGRWLDIFSALGGGRLGDAIARLGNHVACPVHGGSDGFRLDRKLTPQNGFAICNTCRSPQRDARGKAGFGDGLQVLMWLHNWDFPTALDEVYRYCTGHAPEAQSRYAAVNVPTRPAMSREQSEKLILDTWRAGFRLTAPESEIARRHITEFRGLPGPVPDFPEVRFNPKVFYKEGKIRLELPALLLRLLDVNGRPVTVQRNYLDRDGRKAQGIVDKKTMPIPGKEEGRTVNGTACRIDPNPTHWLSVSEGFANALSGRYIMGLPTWCTTVAHSLETLEVPDRVRVMLIWSDVDAQGCGQRAAEHLRERMEAQGRRVLVLTPPSSTNKDAKGNYDWNDAVRQWGVAGFRRSSWFKETQQKIRALSLQAGVLARSAA